MLRACRDDDVAMLKSWLARLRGRAPVLAEARATDAGAFSAIHSASFSRGWSEGEMEVLLLDPQVIAHRAVLGRRMAGFILSRRAADEAEVLSVAVAVRDRGRGLAGSLLALHLRRLAGLGIRQVFLEVDEANVAACRLYARAGFENVGRREGYYRTPDGRGSAALVLRRIL
jgi:ribosomal-protein-alanine N-acetyltransferase